MDHALYRAGFNIKQTDAARTSEEQISAARGSNAPQQLRHRPETGLPSPGIPAEDRCSLDICPEEQAAMSVPHGTFGQQGIGSLNALGGAVIARHGSRRVSLEKFHLHAS
jgi:hypothetical protein